MLSAQLDLAEFLCERAHHARHENLEVEPVLLLRFGFEGNARGLDAFFDFEKEPAANPSVGRGVFELFFRERVARPVRQLRRLRNALAQNEGREVFHARVYHADSLCGLRNIDKARGRKQPAFFERENVAVNRKPDLLDCGIFENFVDVGKPVFERFEPDNPDFLRAAKLENGNQIVLVARKIRARFGVEAEHALAQNFGQNGVEHVVVFHKDYFAPVRDNRQALEHVGVYPARVEALEARAHDGLLRNAAVRAAAIGKI